MNENELKTKLKNSEAIILKLDINPNEDLFKVFATNNQNDTVGYVYFKIKNKVCYLLRIEITNIKYSHIGLGSKLIETMEQIAKDHYCSLVDGKFYPFGNLGEFAKAFYLKNDYLIFKEGYETVIYKDISNINLKTI